MAPLFASSTTAPLSELPDGFPSPFHRFRVRFPPLNVEVVNPLEERDWDQLVLPFREVTVFHSQAWAQVLHEGYDLNPLYLVVRDGCKLCGLLPLMEAQSPLTGRRGVALPFTDNVSLLANDSRVARGILDHAFALGRQRGWKYVEFKGAAGPEKDDPRTILTSAAFPSGIDEGGSNRKPLAFGQREGQQDESKAPRGKPNSNPAQPSLTYYGHILDLQKAEPDLFSVMDSRTRRAVRKAEKSSLQIESSQSVEAVEAFYDLHVQTRRKHGLPPQPKSFFHGIHNHLLTNGLGQIILAKKGGQTLAASIFLCYGRRALFKFGASNPAGQSLRANNLVMWHAMKHFAKQGISTLDLGRCSINNEGLRRFKSGFGARESQIHYYRFNYSKGQFVVHRDLAFNWSNRVFQLMPAILSRMVGELLYKHLA
jgi:Acetyltransferase (GNAT) domain